MSKSKIEWTETTWNPTTGCNKVSEGCKNCYAEVMSNRLKSMGVDKYKNNFKITEHPKELSKPYKWKKSKVIFVNSMSDLFHRKVSLEFIKQVFEVMNENTHHIFQVLTKRPKRVLELQDELLWSHNIWLGTSVENNKVLDRVDTLRKTKAKIKFLSCEPLLGSLNELNLEGIDWVIVGGESGPNARPMKEEWVLEIMDNCKSNQVSFFFKQWGTWGSDGKKRNKKANGRELNGQTWEENPELELNKRILE
jgi:protein gp37